MACSGEEFDNSSATSSSFAIFDFFLTDLPTVQCNQSAMSSWSSDSFVSGEDFRKVIGKTRDQYYDGTTIKLAENGG